MQKEQGQKNKKEDNLGITVKKSEDFSVCLISNCSFSFTLGGRN